MADSEQTRGPKGTRTRDVAIVFFSVVGVTLAATLQFKFVLKATVAPRAVIIPMLVGFTFGMLLRRVVAFRAEERALREALEQRESVITALNRDLEKKVEERTAALQQKEAELLQSQKMEALGRLAGGVAHDFNNLLTSIVGGASLLKSRIARDDHEGSEIVDEILLASERATRLTRQLLTLGRRQVLSCEVLSLADVVDKLRPILRRLISEDIALTVDLDFNCPPVYADATQVEQLVLNLCVNARDAMPRGGRLFIGLREAEDAELPRSLAGQGRFCRLWVEDNGGGMSEEVCSRIFEPFYTTKGVGEGSGLGLSVVHGIIKAANGDVVVKSAPGRGTTFSVYLPVTDRPLVAGSETAPPAAAPATAATVLLVEDEPAVRRFVRHVLVQRGYRVLEASTGIEAVNMAQAHSGPIDLILTDVVMPGKSGPEAIDEIARFRPNARVVFMTGYPGDEIATRYARSFENTVVLQKPFDAVHLGQVIDAELEDVSMRRAEVPNEEAPAKAGA